MQHTDMPYLEELELCASQLLLCVCIRLAIQALKGLQKHILPSENTGSGDQRSTQACHLMAAAGEDLPGI